MSSLQTAFAVLAPVAALVGIVAHSVTNSDRVHAWFQHRRRDDSAES